MSQVSDLVDAWRCKQRKQTYRSNNRRLLASSTRELLHKGGKASVNKLLRNSQILTHSRTSLREKTYTAPMAANVISQIEPLGSNSLSTALPDPMKSIISDFYTKIRLLKKDDGADGWLRLKVRKRFVINSKLSLVETDHPKLRTVILQGICSANSSHVICYGVSFISLYRDVFWCLNWKLG